jgi:macrolide-specific efflux system membrane fusion protein
VLDEGGKIRVTEVAVGLNNNLTAEIIEGLKDGDRVVTGATTVRSGGAGGQGGQRGFGGGPRLFGG